MAVSRNVGDGSYRIAKDMSSRLEGSLTSVHPYLRLSANERLSLWGLFGHGQGELTLAADRTGDDIKTDIKMTMGALGARGVLVSAKETGGFKVAVRADALLVRMKSGATRDILAAETETNRLRLALEGSRAFELTSGGAVLTPLLEVGLRHDGGDAETGTGVELGGRVRYADPAWGLTMEAQVPGLIAHKDSGYEEWRAGGSIRLSPRSDGQGLSFSLLPSYGAAGNGAERLWEQGIAANDHTPSARLEAELGYGLPALDGLLTPYGGLGLSEGGDKSYRAGGRFVLGQMLELSLEGNRREGAARAPEHGLALRAGVRW